MAATLPTQSKFPRCLPSDYPSRGIMLVSIHCKKAVRRLRLYASRCRGVTSTENIHVRLLFFSSLFCPASSAT